MKRLVSACLILVLIALCVGTADAQRFGIRLVGKALNDNAGATWSVINGLNVVGKGGKVFAIMDTAGTGLTGTPAWTLTAKPAGSVAALDSSNRFRASFTADTIGFYYLSVSYGGKTGSDTVFASTYRGVTDVSGCICHTVFLPLDGNLAVWSNTGHANIFKQGITGMLEVATDPTSARNFGAYGKNCIQCHTVGYETTKNNGNFYQVAHATGYDTTWYKVDSLRSLLYYGVYPATTNTVPFASGDYWTLKGDSSAWTKLTAPQKTLASIGCESCHGPLGDHANLGGSPFVGQHNTVAGSASMNIYAADVCNQCHNGSTRHTIGAYYNLSLHSHVPSEQRNSCAPCHQGYSFVKFVESSKDTTGWARYLTAAQLATPISCQACHDPHKASTLTGRTTASGSPEMDPGLRHPEVDSLRNGFKFTPKGNSYVCSYCHTARYSVTVRVQANNPPYYGFTSRFGPHENPQYDMLVGSNGYQFGDATFTGVNTHGGLEDACVTCHMQTRVRVTGPGKTNNNPQPNHSMSMSDTAWGFNAMAVCANCHGEIADPNEIQAFYDFDRNGKIEGVQTEINGLLAQLFATLPHDTTNGVVNVIGSGTVKAVDSLKIKNRLDLVAGIWNYRFVTADASMGVHNAQYAARLLYKSLSWTPTWIKDIVGTTPSEFKLDQNYPNPFNPSTLIRFSLPKESPVKLQVYDVTGSLVKTLLNEAVRAGNKEVTWDGTNASGAKVASGMYLYRLETSSFTATKKMLLLK